jgi:hypothetical protein
VDDRQRSPLGARLVQQVEAGLAGQHDVEQDQVGAGVPQRLPHLAAIADASGAEAVVAQQSGDEVPHRGIVLDDQDVRLQIQAASARRLGAPAARPGRVHHGPHSCAAPAVMPGASHPQSLPRGGRLPGTSTGQIG